MISYKDQTFCASNCINKDCPRYFSEEHKQRVIETMLPVAWSDFSGRCEDYVSPRTVRLEELHTICEDIRTCLISHNHEGVSERLNIMVRKLRQIEQESEYDLG